MDDFVILTDSCCDMTARMAADLELEVLPLSLNMEDRVYHNYLDGREIGFQDFYARLRAGALATTSAISVGVFDEAMRKILDSGRDVLYLAFSSALSTTYQSAVIAADDLREASYGRSLWWTRSAPLWARGCWYTSASRKSGRGRPSTRSTSLRRRPRRRCATGSPWMT